MSTMIDAVREVVTAAYATLSVNEMNEMIAEPYLALRHELLVPIAA